jgi:hypothetical protein
MFGFIGKALSSLVLDKKARRALTGGGKTTAIAEAQARMKDVMTPERAELIRQAMAVRKAKQTVLADLSDAQRQKLVAAAMKRLLNEGSEGK